MRKQWEAFKSYLPWVAILVTFGWASIQIATYSKEEQGEDIIPLRISHWQLEAGVRDAFEEMAAEYQKTHPNVRVYQEAIPESTYGQWMTTQLIGGMAPDIMQIGVGIPRALLISYYNRYYASLTSYALEPNPHNVGTELEGVPLRETYKDNMRQGYVEDLQEYTLMPLAMFGVRIFYNKDLFQKLTGLDKPPTEYRAFLDACEKIKSQMDPQGNPYVPIACSKWHILHWENFMFEPVTYPVMRLVDFGNDGLASREEVFVGFSTGLLTWENPAVKARFQMTREVSNYFQTGFTGLKRDEAVFLFAQEKAVFITTGTWDARSLREQAQGAFEVGITDFPSPTADDPEYGDIIEGPRYEIPETGFLFAVKRDSPHFDLAMDFLLFLASKEGNEKLNKIIGWIPTVRGAETDEFLKDFEPNLEGVYSSLNLITVAIGGESFIKWKQLYSLFLVGQLSYEELAEQYTEFCTQHGSNDWREVNKDWRRGMVKDAMMVALVRAKAYQAEDERAKKSYLTKARQLLRTRQVMREVNMSIQKGMVDGEFAAPERGPYEYSPEALENVRQAIRVEAAGQTN